MDTHENAPNEELAKLKSLTETKKKAMENTHENTKGKTSETKARLFENVVAELEQRNFEMESLLKSSEKYCTDMQTMIKKRDKEITSLRANTVVMYTLDGRVSTVNKEISQLNNQMTHLTNDMTVSKKEERKLYKRIKELNEKDVHRGKDFSERVVDLTGKLSWVDDQIIDKEGLIEKHENTLNGLFDTCDQLGENNSNVKKEVQNFLRSGERMKAGNSKLQKCKEYLESQVDNLVKDLKKTTGENEKYKLEIANLASDKQNHRTQFNLLEEKEQDIKDELVHLNNMLTETQNTLKKYESGKLRSAVTTNKINREKHSNDLILTELLNKISEHKCHIENVEDNLGGSNESVKMLRMRVSEMESKVNNYQENYVERHEAEKIRKDLQVRHRLDMNTQRNRVSTVLNKKENDLVKSIKESLLESKKEKPDHNYDDTKFTIFDL